MTANIFVLLFLVLGGLVPFAYSTCFSCVNPASTADTSANFIYAFNCAKTLRFTSGSAGSTCLCDSASFSIPGQYYNTCQENVSSVVPSRMH